MSFKPDVDSKALTVDIVLMQTGSRRGMSRNRGTILCISRNDFINRPSLPLIWSTLINPPYLAGPMLEVYELVVISICITSYVGRQVYRAIYRGP